MTIITNDERERIIAEYYLIREETKITHKTVHENSGISLRRIIDYSKTGIGNCHDTTLIRLKKFINYYHQEIEPPITDIYTLLNRKLGTRKKHYEAFLKSYEGTYKCCRLTGGTNKILITKLKIFSGADGVPEFIHRENKASDSQETIGEILEHRGIILSSQNSLTFFSVGYGNIRQIKAVIDNDETTTKFSGILLTVNDKLEPFASRILIYKLKNKDIKDEEFSSYAIDDPNFKWLLKYIKNGLNNSEVLTLT